MIIFCFFFLFKLDFRRQSWLVFSRDFRKINEKQTIIYGLAKMWLGRGASWLFWEGLTEIISHYNKFIANCNFIINLIFSSYFEKERGVYFKFALRGLLPYFWTNTHTHTHTHKHIHVYLYICISFRFFLGHLKICFLLLTKNHW